MLEKFIQDRTLSCLPFPPNEGQTALLQSLSAFLVSPVIGADGLRSAFVLKGYAGTGKTSIVAALVKALRALQQPVVLLAPTGRAAKVLSAYSGQPAYTIHRHIYRQQQLGVERFSLADNRYRDTLFIIDEASMISARHEDSPFGTGQLLDDLVAYVYAGSGCRMLLSGDDAQLPPVGSSVSPALDAQYLAGYGLHVATCTLTQVARQALDSGILQNATALRTCLADLPLHLPDFPFVCTPDFRPVSGGEVLEVLEQCYREAGVEETLILTRSNRRTNLYNQGVRARLLWKEDEISAGDRVMVSKNNYYWSAAYDDLPFIANGDMLEIVRLRNMREMYGFRFADASLRSLDYDWEIDATVWIDTLNSDSPEANYTLQQTLFARIAEDYPELAHSRRKLVEAVYQSPYFNALQIRFAYAVTCHKAQGGQWKRVLIDAGNVPVGQRNADYCRWLYTAVTRATECVYWLCPYRE